MRGVQSASGIRAVATAGVVLGLLEVVFVLGSIAFFVLLPLWVGEI